MKKNLLVTLLFIFCFGHANAEKKLVIGTDATYPPFEYLNQNGEFEGVDIEIGRRIGKELGREVEFRNINFDGLITALQTGNIDVVLSAMTASEERRQSIAFSEPYVKTGISMLIAKKSAVNDVDDLKQSIKRVEKIRFNVAESWAREHLPDVPRVTLDADAACVLEVVNGSVDAWVYDQISIMNFHARHPDTTRANLAVIREEVWAAGLRKGDDDLRAKINEVLAKMKADGSFTALAEKYLAKERAMMQAQNLPFVFE